MLDDLTPFERLLISDEVPKEGTPLQQQFKENPKLLLREAGYSSHPNLSVISLVFCLGNFNLADYILKSNHTFVANADPFYLGKIYLNFDRLPESAGVNFYLALITWQLYFQQNKLPELLETTIANEIRIKQTYYDKFYWENENNKICYTCDQPNTIEHLTFMRTQAEWFMRIAYEVFQLEEQLNITLQEAETTWSRFSNWFVPNNNKTQEICAKLGDYYLHIAYMEIRSKAAFFYFTKKANDYYARSSNDHQNIRKKLSELVNQISSDPYQAWHEATDNQPEPLKGCGTIETNYSLIDAAEAWKNAFNFAHQKILDQGVHSSLHFMETNSARTSSTERNSQSSGESSEAKKTDSQMTNVGLHRRCKGPENSNVTANPLLQPHFNDSP